MIDPSFSLLMVDPVSGIVEAVPAAAVGSKLDAGWVLLDEPDVSEAQ